MATSVVPERSNRFWQFYDEQVRWLKKKIAAVDLFDETMADKAVSNPWYALGSMVYLFWMFTIVSGLLLIIWYIPNTARAYDSIIHIQEATFGGFGWMIRGIHKYGADAVIIAATMRVYRLYFTGEYKQHELAWVISIVMLILFMFSGLTGYLLIWNQRAFWASKVFATFPTYIDQIPYLGLLNTGMTTAQFMLGGTAIGEATLTRFYGGHFALSMATLIFVEAYFVRVGLRRINLSWAGISVCLGMLILVSAMLPPELGSRANRAETPLPILSDWYFLGLYQMMKEMKPLYAVIGTMFIPLFALLMPAFDRAKDVPTRKRPFYMAVGIGALIHWLLMSWMIIKDWAVISTDPPKIWGSFALILLCGAMFEYRQMGFPRKAVIKWAVVTYIGWLAYVGLFGWWTRFRLPQYTASYYPPGISRVLTDEDAAKRDRLNSRWLDPTPDDGEPPTFRQQVAMTFRAPVVTEWYVPDEEQGATLVSAQRDVQGWWVIMSALLALCALISIGSTPPEGIESPIFPSRTARGQAIKGIKPQREESKPRAAPEAAG